MSSGKRAVVTGGANGIGQAFCKRLGRTAPTSSLPTSPTARKPSARSRQAAAPRSRFAGTLAFLASDDAAFITGQTVVVDGGWRFLVAP